VSSFDREKGESHHMTHNITRALLLVIAATSCAFAQDKGDVIYQTAGQ